MQFSNRVYDFIKALAQVILPGLGTLYFAVADIWTLPSPDKVVGTITAFDAFLGVLLSVSSASYKPTHAGNIVIDDSGPKKIYRLELAVDPEDIDPNKTVTFGVTTAQPETPVDLPSAMTS